MSGLLELVDRHWGDYVYTADYIRNLFVFSLFVSFKPARRTWTIGGAKELLRLTKQAAVNSRLKNSRERRRTQSSLKTRCGCCCCCFFFFFFFFCCSFCFQCYSKGHLINGGEALLAENKRPREHDMSLLPRGRFFMKKSPRICKCPKANICSGHWRTQPPEEALRFGKRLWLACAHGPEACRKPQNS